MRELSHTCEDVGTLLLAKRPLRTVSGQPLIAGHTEQSDRLDGLTSSPIEGPSPCWMELQLDPLAFSTSMHPCSQS